MTINDVPGIYGIHCKTNGKWYVGGSKHPTRRIKDHERNMKLDASLHSLYGDDYQFEYKGEMGRDYSIFGSSCFEFVLLEPVNNVSELLDAEREWVEKLNSHSCGYNQQAAGRNRYWGV